MWVGGECGGRGPRTPMSLTLPTSHWLKSLLKELAWRNIHCVHAAWRPDQPQREREGRGAIAASEGAERGGVVRAVCECGGRVKACGVRSQAE